MPRSTALLSLMSSSLNICGGLRQCVSEVPVDVTSLPDVVLVVIEDIVVVATFTFSSKVSRSVYINMEQK